MSELSFGKYTSSLTIIFPVNDELPQFKFLPPVSFTISIHFSRSMFLSPTGSTALMVILPSMPIFAFTFPALFKENSNPFHAEYTVISLLTVVFSSKSGLSAFLPVAQPKNLLPSFVGFFIGKLPLLAFIVSPLYAIS